MTIFYIPSPASFIIFNINYDRSRYLQPLAAVIDVYTAVQFMTAHKKRRPVNALFLS